MTVLAALKGVAWLLPAGVFVWMAATGWSSAFAAWAYGKPLLQTPVRLITQPPQTTTAGAPPLTQALRVADAPGSLVMVPGSGAPLLIKQEEEGVIAVDAIPGGEIDRVRDAAVEERFAVEIVIEAAPTLYYGYRYSLTWDPKIIAFDGAEQVAPKGLTECVGPEAFDNGVFGGCSSGRTTGVGGVATVHLRCVAEGASRLDLVAPPGPQAPTKTPEPTEVIVIPAPPLNGTALLAESGDVQGVSLQGGTITCQAPTPTPTPSPTPAATQAVTGTPTASPTSTPTVTVSPPGPRDNHEEGPSLKPWDQPNDFLDVLGGRWTLAHLALPLLASAYVAVAVGVVYNLLVKTAWDIWDRRTKYTSVAPTGGEPLPEIDEQHEAQS